MKVQNSPKSRLTLLRADGSLEPLHLKPAPFSSAVVVLARERCLFERLDVAAGMSGRAAAQAARLHADTAAPYQRYGSLITHKGNSYGIWWWDAQWVGEKLGGAGLDPNARILPEPMVRAAGDGWRVARASTGYEAQLWKNGFLHADLWRRTAFDTAAWQDFVRVQGAAGAPGGESAVLMAQEAPWTLSSPYRRMILSDWTPQKTAETAIAAAVVAAVCGALFFAGEGLGLRRDTAQKTAQAEMLEKATPKGADGTGGLNVLRTALEGSDPMVMLQSAQELIEPFGHKLVAFETTREAVTIVLPGAAAEDISQMSNELLTSPYFESVRSSLNQEAGELTISMTPKGVKAEPKGRAGATRTASAP
jgi:hypothetical protein